MHSIVIKILHYIEDREDDNDIKKIFEILVYITMSPRLQQKRKIHLEIRVAIIQKYAPYQQQ